MTPAIAPPPVYMSPTASTSVSMSVTADMAGAYDDLVEEPMNYAPISAGRVTGPEFEDEAWTDDDTGPMGF